MDAYIFQADLYCPNCADDIMNKIIAEGKQPEELDNEETYDSDDFPKGPILDGGGEADHWQRCGTCGCFLGNALTSEGVKTEAENIANIEIFMMTAEDILSYGEDSCWYSEDDEAYLRPGWYWWYCWPGCLPDSDPRGPYSSYAEACQEIVDENWPEEGTTY